MAISINVNGLSMTHKGSNGMSIATLPDVCNTPTPDGPQPLPYPNISRTNSLTKGTKTVTADGGNMIAIDGSEFSSSSGDEPGSLGGVTSGTFTKESTWITYSFDVMAEGKGVCRLTDKKMQNHGNTADLAGEIHASLLGDYWDSDCILKIFCSGDKSDKEIVSKLSKLTIHKRMVKQVHFKKYVKGSWVDSGFTSGGSANGKEVWINEDTECDNAASTLFHEVTHTDQSSSMNDSQREYDAYFKTEQWRIKKGLPAYNSSFRKKVNGKTIPNIDAIKANVDKSYAYNIPTPVGGGPAPPRVMGLASNGIDVLLKDGTTRPPAEGDAYRLPDTGGEVIETIDPSKWKCP